MKKVLIITYYWPPGSGPGVQRWLKFCKFLPEYGWQPEVVTVRNGSYPSTDESLENDIPLGLTVTKTDTLEPFALYNALRGKKGKSVEVAMGNIKGKRSTFSKFANYIRSNYFIPDARVGWNNYAFKAASKIIEKSRPDCVITTGPPHSTHLVGLKLKKRFNIKWIADFRDPWTTIYYNEFLLRTQSAKDKDQRLENQVLENSDLILSASPGITQDLTDRASQIQTIFNGFDKEDFEEANTILPDRNTFRMSYVGNLKPFQNTTAVWQALKELSNELDGFKRQFEFEVTGNLANQVKQGMKDADIEDLVILKDFVPHKEAVHRMLSSNLLFLPIPIDKGNKRILTGKIFEYLATQRPILSVGPKDGNASEVLNECGQLPMLDYQDKAGIKKTIAEQFLAFKEGNYNPKKGNEHYLNYSRKGTTRKLASLMNNL